MKQFGVIGIALLACCGCRDSNEASCWMRPGNRATVTQTWSQKELQALTIHDHVDVTWRWDSISDVSVTWTGPENLLSYASAEWEGGHLVIGHLDRCEWARRLDAVVHAEITSGMWNVLAIRGQGEFLMDSVWKGGSLSVEAFASSSELNLNVNADTVTVKLHAGPASAKVHGHADVLQAYSSGLGALDASQCQTRYAFINQSGVIPLEFAATEYAYVAINSPGDVIVHGGYPTEVTLETTSTGELLEE